MNDDLRSSLEEAGRRPVPEPRAAFTSALEDRLVAIAEASVSERAAVAGVAPASGPLPASEPPPGPPRSRPAFGFAAGLAGLAAVLAIAVVMSGFGVRSTLAFELTDATNVEVALADGTTLVDPEGLLLPDGAVVRIGTGGSARIGDVLLGAGDVARVTDRRLNVDRRDDSTTTVAATPGPTRTPAIPTDAPPPGTPVPSYRPATPKPDVSLPPSATATPRIVAPTATPSVYLAASPTPAAVVKALKLEARRTGASEVGASWTSVSGAVSYVLVARASTDGTARDPIYPGSPVIGEFTHPPLKPLLFRVGPDVVQVRLLVVALSADGRVIGRSNIATVNLPR